MERDVAVSGFGISAAYLLFALDESHRIETVVDLEGDLVSDRDFRNRRDIGHDDRRILFDLDDDTVFVPDALRAYMVETA